MEIVWKGNERTNHGSREGTVPFVIVDHISDGSMGSLDAWFTSPSNTVSSAHFGVGKDGSIHQYVRIEDKAWAQGIKPEEIQQATARVVHDQGVNPNLYCVSIEHEGTTGDLTESQFQATLWLHRFIRNTIWEKWDLRFPLDSYHVIGHFQVNPHRKPNCPGPKFPWARLYAELAKIDREEEAEMKEITDRLAALETRSAALEAKNATLEAKNAALEARNSAVETENAALEGKAAALDKRVKDLESALHLPSVPEWAKKSVQEAVQKGLINTPENGSYDFYRVLAILDRKGMI